MCVSVCAFRFFIRCISVIFFRFQVSTFRPVANDLVRNDVFLLGFSILDLGTLVEDLFGLVVDNDSETHILSQFDDVIENLNTYRKISGCVFRPFTLNRIPTTKPS
jgi:hypothetical protein